MNHNPDPIQTLGEIRTLMERSARFISLSGLSGVSAGIAALVGATLVYIYTGKVPFDGRVFAHGYLLENEKWGMSYPLFFLLLGSGVLALAIGGGIFFTTRNARRKGLKVWDKLTLLDVDQPDGSPGNRRCFLPCPVALSGGRVCGSNNPCVLRYGAAACQ